MTGYDIDARRIAKLRSGIDPAGLLPREAFEGVRHPVHGRRKPPVGSLVLHRDGTSTPVDEERTGPTSGALLAATRPIASPPLPGDCVVYESTVWPGCTEERCIPLLEAVSASGRAETLKGRLPPNGSTPGDEEHTLAGTVKVVSGCDAEALDAIARVYAAAGRGGNLPGLRHTGGGRSGENPGEHPARREHRPDERMLGTLRTAGNRHDGGAPDGRDQMELRTLPPGAGRRPLHRRDPYHLLARAEEAGVELPVMRARAARSTNGRAAASPAS